MEAQFSLELQRCNDFYTHKLQELGECLQELEHALQLLASVSTAPALIPFSDVPEGDAQLADRLARPRVRRLSVQEEHKRSRMNVRAQLVELYREAQQLINFGMLNYTGTME